MNIENSDIVLLWRTAFRLLCSIAIQTQQGVTLFIYLFILNKIAVKRVLFEEVNGK